MAPAFRSGMVPATFVAGATRAWRIDSLTSLSASL
jgi:hypothetical protein